jgi:hypothetical protein
MTKVKTKLDLYRAQVSYLDTQLTQAKKVIKAYKDLENP